MKRVILLGIFIALVTASCAKKENNNPKGAWQMVAMQRIDNGKATNYFSDRYHIYQIKMWSDKYFSFIGTYKVDTVIVDRYGAGTYSLEGNRYQEDVMYHFDKAYKGQKVNMLLEIRNDTLCQIFPIDESGNPIKKQYYIEKYMRLK
ncbi:MAG: hypothetical protein LLG13_07985 [Bacteroidales bacterium]|nr:hypothetical protein [Bacteroidales bacterium]